MAKQIIRIGDYVRVVHPEFFVRCGYPETQKGVFDAMSITDDTTVHTMFRQMGIPAREGYVRTIMQRLAHYRWRESGCGGPYRRIHTKTLEDAEGLVFRVVSKRTCITGDYFAPSMYQDWESGHFESEEGGLRNRQTHVILCVESVDYLFSGDEQIESCNVELIKDKTK